MYLLDTNVVSEVLHWTPAPLVADWYRRHDAMVLYLSTVSEAELRFGTEVMPRGRKREALINEIGNILSVDFKGRILPFDSESAEEYALIAASRQRAGHPIDTADAQIAAMAPSRGKALVNRNVRDNKNIFV